MVLYDPWRDEVIEQQKADFCIRRQYNCYAKSYEPFNYNLRLRTNKDILFEFDDNSIWKSFHRDRINPPFYSYLTLSELCVLVNLKYIPACTSFRRKISSFLRNS